MKILFYCGIHNLVNFNRIRPFYDMCYGFDANPEKIEQAGIFYANDPGVKIIYGALTEKGGKDIEFVITTNWTPASSLGQPNPDFVHMKTGLLQAQKKIQVPTINLHDFCLANGISEIDTLITDLQGIDLTVLATMSEFLKKGKIREIQCEVEPDDTPPRYLGIPTGKLTEFNRLLSDQYDILWIDPENPKQAEGAWEMDVRWRVKGGQPQDGIEFFMEKEFLVAKNPSVVALSTYSQYREDLVIDALFKHKPDGCYVDIGANDPVVFSNTNLFYSRGWHGINVEPEPRLHAKLCAQRGRDINIKAGVGPKPGIMTFYRMSADTLSSFNKQAALEAGALYGSTLVAEEQTEVMALQDIMASHLGGRKIDFLSVDAEGYDLAVLESNDWSRYRPSAVMVEINVGGNNIVAFLQKQDYVLIFDNGTNGIFIAREFCDTLDDAVREDLRKLEKSSGLRTVLPQAGGKNKLIINIVYGHLRPNDLKEYRRGNISILWSHLPIEGCDHYVYHNAFSYHGRRPGLNILLMLEPAVVLPGEFDEALWNHFDHVFGLFDIFEGMGGKFHKIFFPCIEDLDKTTAATPQNQRDKFYPLEGRRNAICMISGNKRSHVPGELYSMRIEIADWFSKNSKIPFDVYGRPAFPLSNYRGEIPEDQKLATLKQYRFSLCFENTNHPVLSSGYVTEKMIDCLLARTVPIYLGASNIEKYIPASCYIDYRKFAGPEKLDEYLQTMSNHEYKQMISAIDQWVTRGNLQKHSTQAFCDTMAGICARASEQSLDMLFNGEESWNKVKALPPTARFWQFISQPVMWTWKHLAKAEGPVVKNGKLVSRHHVTTDLKSDPVNPSAGKSFLIGKKPVMKVLAAGVKFFSGNARLGYDYGWWNHFDILNRFENIEMHFFDYATEVQQRGLAGMSERLYESVYKEKPDILLYHPASGLGGILHDSLKSITGSTDTQTVIWMNNNLPLSNEEAALWAPCADYVITLSPESARHFTAAGFGSKVIKSQWGFNPYTYAPSCVRSREMSFCGAAKGNRSDILNHIKRSGLSVDVFGFGWHEDSFIPFYDMVRIMGQSRINLNLGDTIDPGINQINKRTFEVPGCRGFLLTLPADHLEEYYEPGKEVIIASSTEELIDKAKYYLTHERERERIAQRGYERTQAEHTWAKRLIDIFKHIGFTAIPRKLPAISGQSLFQQTSRQSLPVSGKPSAPETLTEKPIDDDHSQIETSVVVVGFNKLEYTKRCIESILNYTQGPYELVLTDNGSTDGTFEYFKWIKSFHPHTRVVKNFANRNVEALGNYSFSLANGKYIAGIANDAVVHEGWLHNLIKQIEVAPDVAIVGSRSNSISGPQIAQVNYDTLEEYHACADEWRKHHQGSSFPVDRLVGMAAILRKSVLERIGAMDPDLPVNGRDGGYGFSDDDFSLRLRLAGYRSLVADDVLIHHYGSVTTKHYRPDLFGAPQNINKEKYIKKVRNNNRVTFGPDGKMILHPYSLDDAIPVDERTAIRTPQICFVETGDLLSKKSGAENIYTAVAGKFNGIMISSQDQSIRSIIFNAVAEKQYDFLILIDLRLAPSEEVISELADSAVCHPDVAILVPVGNYAPATHACKTDSTQAVEIIPYADLSVCAINLKMIRPLLPGLTQCESDEEFLWFLQRRVRGESYFIAKANTIEINGGAPVMDHPYDHQALPEQLIKEKKFTEAVAIYQGDLLKDPSFAEAYYQLACIAREQGQLEEAVKRALQALGADPHHIESLIFLSGLFMAQNDWERAESFVGQANFKQPGHPEVQKIVAAYEKAIKENPHLFQTKSMHRIPTLTHAEFVKGRTSIIVAASSNSSRECLAAIKKHTKVPYELILIDALTSFDLKKKLRKSVKEHSPYKILEHNPKDALLQSINRGINSSTGEYIVVLNDDVVVSEGWLAGMLACIHHAPDAGIIGPMTNQGAGPQNVSDASYHSVNQLDKYAAQFKKRFQDRRIPSRNIAGFCLFFQRTLVEKIALFDERFDTGQYEDICRRAALEGYRNYIAGDVFIHHSKGKESQGDRKLFDEKWSIDHTSPEGTKLAVLRARELADHLYLTGETDQAIKTLVDCIKIAPDAGNIYYDMVRIFMETKRFAEAWAVIEAVPESAKNELTGLACAGYAKEGLGQDDEALAYADRILALNETDPAGLNLKGVLAFKNGEKDKALNYFEKAILADPGYGDAYTNLGVLYWGLDQKEESLSHLQRGFILSPATPDNSSLYHSIASSLGRLGQAEEDFREACRLYPHHKNLVFLWIDLLLQQGKYDSALLKIEDTLDTFGLDEGTLNAALAVREKVGPLQIETTSKRGALSLCMIVKNEERNLVKCLKSVRDVVDELIVVDTGSTDKTKDIAKVFGAKVFDFPWTGDFSAARNHSLAQAKGDWILILDADEVISSLDFDELKSLIHRRTASPVAYSIVTRNYTNNASAIGWTQNDGKYPEETCTGWIKAAQVRLLSNTKDIFFTNDVHETLEDSLTTAKIPIFNCGVVVHHFGK